MNFGIAPKETETYLHWKEAKLYCQFLDYDGSGWRLPTKEELNWMYENKTDDNQFEESLYWSSTEGNNGYFGWVQIFSNGHQHTVYPKTRIYLVRAIRDKS